MVSNDVAGNSDLSGYASKSSANDQVGRSVISTDGGAYVGGNVKVGGDFVGRDKTIVDKPEADESSAPLEAASGQTLEIRFEPLLEESKRSKNPERSTELVKKLMQLMSGAEAGTDFEIAEHIDAIAYQVPSAASLIVAIFQDKDVKSNSGPATQYVVQRLERQQ